MGFDPATLAIGATALSVGSTAMTGIMTRNNQKAQSQQIEMAQKSNASAVSQAEQDKQREIAMAVYQKERESRRAESMARAGQANAGIAGITATRQVDNVVFQNMLDINYIKTQGENSLINISNQGFNQASELQSSLNTSKRNTPSGLEIGISTATAGIKSYATTSAYNKGFK